MIILWNINKSQLKYIYTKHFSLQIQKKVEVEKILNKNQKHQVKWKEWFTTKNLKAIQTFEKLLKDIVTISSTFEKSFNIIIKNHIAKNKSTKAFATRQSKDFNDLNFFIFDIKHWVFNLILTFIFFKIFLLRNNRVMTIASNFSFSTILKTYSSRLRFNDDHDIFTQTLLKRTHFEHFKRDDKFVIAIQERLIKQQRSQKKSIKKSWRSISKAKRSRFWWVRDMMRCEMRTRFQFSFMSTFSLERLRTSVKKERNSVTIQKY